MLAMPRHEGWLRGFVDGWSLHTGEIVISRKCAQYRRDIPHHQTSLSFQAKEYQLSVRMLLLLYAFLTFVKQSQHKHRAREVLRFFVRRFLPGALFLCRSSWARNVLLSHSQLLMVSGHDRWVYQRQSFGRNRTGSSRSPPEI